MESRGTAPKTMEDIGTKALTHVLYWFRLFGARFSASP